MTEAVQSKAKMVLLVKEYVTKKDPLSLTTERSKTYIQLIKTEESNNYRVGYTIHVCVEHQWETDEYISLCIVNGNEEPTN